MGDYKKMATQTWIKHAGEILKMIERQNVEGAIQYYHKDVICSGPGEEDLFKGHEELKASWLKNSDMFPLCQWEEPFMNGEIGVWRGQIGPCKFECLIKTKDDLIIECVSRVIDDETKNISQIREMNN